MIVVPIAGIVIVIGGAVIVGPIIALGVGFVALFEDNSTEEKTEENEETA